LEFLITNSATQKIDSLLFYLMKKRKKRNSLITKPNQLSFDFNVNDPIEIHTPKSDISDLRKELAWENRPIIELVKS
jgi:hypothetical protein